MKTFITLFALMIGFSTQARTIASSAKMLCHTPRLHQAFMVGQTQITILDESSEAPDRKLASLEGIRTKFEGNGFTKMVDFEGKKHIIHVADVNAPSQINDYVIIRSREGHELTYPLECSRVN